jgi:uncharacterized caspase-like protein
VNKPTAFILQKLLLTAFVVLISCASHAQEPAIGRVALVIGNGDYPTERLNSPVNDARAIAKLLRSLGFDVKAYENLDGTAMRRAVAEFGERLVEGGVGLFFYSGHGIQVNGKNYLIPINGEIKSERYISAETVEVDTVLGYMDGAKSAVNVLILDACRDNPFARQFRSVTRGLAFMDAPVGSYIAYATSPGSVTTDTSGGNGVWTGELLRAIAEPGLTIEDVFKRARLEVIRKTNGRQNPWDASSLTGDFYFLPRAKPENAVLTSSSEQPAKIAANLDGGIKGKDGAEMVLIPAGEFWMGSSDAEVEDVKRWCQRATVTKDGLPTVTLRSGMRNRAGRFI